MGLLGPLSVLLHPFIIRFPVALIGLFLTSGTQLSAYPILDERSCLIAMFVVFDLDIVHQLILVYTPLQHWVLHGGRHGIIGQNKEGIVSLAGASIPLPFYPPPL